MNQASLYRCINEQSRRDVKNILAKYAQLLQWRQDGHDALIDVGTGSGDVLMDFIHPLMPTNFELLLGTDISEQMISYAHKSYASFEHVKFEVLDIAVDVLPQHMRGNFDHVTSFYCLHWVKNQRKMLQNISNLLRSDIGGDCLLVLMGTQFLYFVYEIFSKHSKWAQYMQDYKKFVSPYHQNANAAAEFLELLQDAGFVDCHVEVQKNFYVYDGVQEIRNLFRVLCPFFDRMPATLHEEFLDDFVNIMVSLNLRQSKENSDDHGYISRYELVVAYARKPPVLRACDGDIKA